MNVITEHKGTRNGTDSDESPPEIFSAGTKPTSVRPEAMEVMREIGIDVSSLRSKSVDEFVGQEFAFVITACDNGNEPCPIFPGRTRRIRRRFDDPAAVHGSEEERTAVFRWVRDQIGGRIKTFVDTL